MQMNIIDDVLGIVPEAHTAQDIKTQFEFDAADAEEFTNMLKIAYTNIRSSLNAQIPMLWKQNKLNQQINDLRAVTYSQNGVGVQELNRQMKADKNIIKLEEELATVQVGLNILNSEIRYNEGLIKSVNSLLYSAK